MIEVIFIFMFEVWNIKTKLCWKCWQIWRMIFEKRAKPKICLVLMLPRLEYGNFCLRDGRNYEESIRELKLGKIYPTKNLQIISQSCSALRFIQDHARGSNCPGQHHVVKIVIIFICLYLLFFLSLFVFTSTWWPP